MSGWENKTRINTRTGEVLHIYFLAGWWYLACGGHDVIRSKHFPEVFKKYNHYEFT